MLLSVSPGSCNCHVNVIMETRAAARLSICTAWVSCVCPGTQRSLCLHIGEEVSSTTASQAVFNHLKPGCLRLVWK